MYASDKHDSLIKGATYMVNGAPRTYLGAMYAEGGYKYRFKGEGPNSYATKTARELDKMEVQPA